jgi:hypothetical protein
VRQAANAICCITLDPSQTPPPPADPAKLDALVQAQTSLVMDAPAAAGVDTSTALTVWQLVSAGDDVVAAASTAVAPNA